ncbi:unnamed protein product [Sphagnum jensenii]|uniref:Uncharacterized protein n=1 Tax=Sphagnum jensenii TaxID=128206 RepID=A0ABP0VB08_9BRYO
MRTRKYMGKRLKAPLVISNTSSHIRFIMLCNMAQAGVVVFSRRNEEGSDSMGPVSIFLMEVLELTIIAT